MNKPHCLFVSLLMFFGFLSIIIAIVLAVAMLGGTDIEFWHESAISKWHSYGAMLVGLIGLSFSMTLNFYLITKFSLWISTFINGYILRRDPTAKTQALSSSTPSSLSS